MWIEPKTNWVATDTVTADDYNRIAGNLYYLKDALSALFSPTSLTTMDDDKNYLSTIYAREMNAVESNLDALNNASYAFDIGAAETYVSNGKTPLYVELNRIESATLKLKEQVEADKKLLQTLPFTLGGAKKLCPNSGIINEFELVAKGLDVNYSISKSDLSQNTYFVVFTKIHEHQPDYYFYFNIDAGYVSFYAYSYVSYDDVDLTPNYHPTLPRIDYLEDKSDFIIGISNGNLFFQDINYAHEGYENFYTQELIFNSISGLNIQGATAREDYLIYKVNRVMQEDELKSYTMQIRSIPT